MVGWFCGWTILFMNWTVFLCQNGLTFVTCYPQTQTHSCFCWHSKQKTFYIHYILTNWTWSWDRVLVHHITDKHVLLEHCHGEWKSMIRYYLGKNKVLLITVFICIVFLKFNLWWKLILSRPHSTYILFSLFCFSILKFNNYWTFSVSEVFWDVPSFSKEKYIIMFISRVHDYIYILYYAHVTPTERKHFYFLGFGKMISIKMCTYIRKE